MSAALVEAAVVGIRTGLALVLAWVAAVAWASHQWEDPGTRRRMTRWLAAGVAVAAVVVLASWAMPADQGGRILLSKITGMEFFVLLLGSMGVLFGVSAGATRQGPLRVLRTPWIAGLGLLGLSALYLAPDGVGAVLYLRELARMRETTLAVAAGALVGGLVTAAALWFALRSRVQALGRALGTGQFLLLLALLKLMAGGSEGFGRFSLIPEVQSLAMKLVHDLVHFSFLVILVPDHPLLRLSAWNFIGFFFGSNAGMMIALLLLVAPPVVWIAGSLLAPYVLDRVGLSAPERRVARAAQRRDRLIAALPVLAFVAVVSGAWYVGVQDRGLATFDPSPKPVVEDRGRVMIPLTDPTMDLMDGGLYKFSLTKDGRVIRFLIIQKPDGHLAVTLDACEMCPPDGYALTGDTLLCIYCNTPIPMDTVGIAGGCNPVPVEAEVTAQHVIIQADELDRMWGEVLQRAGER